MATPNLRQTLAAMLAMAATEPEQRRVRKARIGYQRTLAERVAGMPKMSPPKRTSMRRIPGVSLADLLSGFKGPRRV